MDINNLIAGFLFSGLGVIYFRYGKNESLGVALACGIILMVYPYFIENYIYTIAIGSGLCVLPFIFKV